MINVQLTNEQAKVLLDLLVYHDISVRLGTRDVKNGSLAINDLEYKLRLDHRLYAVRPQLEEQLGINKKISSSIISDPLGR